MLLPWRKLMAVDWLLAQPVDATQAQSDANDVVDDARSRHRMCQRGVR
jgi:hypothetical protein